MASYNELFARPVSWVVTRKGKGIAQISRRGDGYAVDLQGTPLPATYETIDQALRAIDRRI